MVAFAIQSTTHNLGPYIFGKEFIILTEHRNTKETSREYFSKFSIGNKHVYQVYV